MPPVVKGTIKEGGTPAQAPFVPSPPKGGGVGTPSPPPANNTNPPATSPPPSAGPAATAMLQAINFAGMKVGYFKYDLDNTTTNIYGESLEKWYYPPMEIKCLIERGGLTYNDADFGPDPSQNITVSIPRLIIEQFNFTPEVGDILTDRDRYYEVSVVDSQFFTNAGAPTTAQTANNTGNLIIYILTCTLVRTTKLNIIPS
jgi:hypothetical protein